MRSPRRRSEHGSVTAETALLMPAVVLLIAAVLTVGRVVDDQIRCTDAARAAARMAARGESTARIAAVAQTAGPAGSRVSVVTGSPSGGHAQVRVTVQSQLRLPLLGNPVLTVRGTAVSDSEGG